MSGNKDAVAEHTIHHALHQLALGQLDDSTAYESFLAVQSLVSEIFRRFRYAEGKDEIEEREELLAQLRGCSKLVEYSLKRFGVELLFENDAHGYPAVATIMKALYASGQHETMSELTAVVDKTLRKALLGDDGEGDRDSQKRKSRKDERRWNVQVKGMGRNFFDMDLDGGTYNQIRSAFHSEAFKKFVAVFVTYVFERGSRLSTTRLSIICDNILERRTLPPLQRKTKNSGYISVSLWNANSKDIILRFDNQTFVYVIENHDQIAPVVSEILEKIDEHTGTVLPSEMETNHHQHTNGGVQE